MRACTAEVVFRTSSAPTFERGVIVVAEEGSAHPAGDEMVAAELVCAGEVCAGKEHGR